MTLSEKLYVKLYISGNIVILGVDMESRISLEEIPKSFNSPKDNAVYKILGIGCAKTRTSSTIGHYRAITKRGLHWVIYDDMKTSATVVTSTFEVHPELLIYVKT